MAGRMDKLKTLRTFICVAEQASFAEAGRRMNMSPTTVTRSIAALEASLGVQLLMRTTRSVRLTEEGSLFLERCRAGIAQIDQAVESVQGSRSGPSGTLTVTAPVLFGKMYVMPVVLELLHLHPQLQIRLILRDSLLRLVEEGIDIAVRIADLPDSSLHMVPVGEVRRVFSASPDYLARKGRPASLADLRHHDLIWVEDEGGPHRGWGLDEVRQAGGVPRLSVSHVDAAIAAAVAGLGVLRTLSYQVAGEIEAGRLESLLRDDESPALPVSLLFDGGRKHHPNVRAFIEATKRHMKPF